MLYKNRSSKIVRANRSPWFSRSAYLGKIVRSFGRLTLRGSKLSEVGRLAGVTLNPWRPQPLEPVTLASCQAFRLH